MGRRTDQETAMPTLSRLVLAAGLLCLAACQRAPDTDEGAAPDANAAKPAAADVAVPPSAGPVASAGDYRCADGTRLQALFGDHDVALQWPDGRRLVLPRAESASPGGGDAFVGETVSLQRDGARLQLHDGDRAATSCEPGLAAAVHDGADADADATTGAGTGLVAASRYACDAGTVLTRNEDGSYRAEIPGNAPIRLTRIAGSTPPVYTGSSLYLRIGDGGAILSQGDRTNELRCTAGRGR
jgi:hypothetical protein